MLEFAPYTLLSFATLLSYLTPSAHSAPIPFQLLQFNASESSSLPVPVPLISNSLSTSYFAQSTTLVASTTASSFAVSSAVTSAVPSSDATSPTSSASSVTSSTTTAPAVLANTGDSTQSDIDTIRQRRIAIILQDVVDPLVGTISNISDWVSTLGPDGQWPSSQVDYTTGCGGQKANWPAEVHWQRLAFMAAAWHGGVEGADEFVNNSSLLDAISRGMDFWFGNDFTDHSCLVGQCKCNSAGLWNTNWFSNLIGIPSLVGETCLLLGTDKLSQSQLDGCKSMTSRTAATLVDGVQGMGQLTGANTLDVAKITIDGGLLTSNAAQIAEGYKHVHSEVVVRDTVKADGIRPDGSFGQHAGLMYNGNYGKDYANDVLTLEIAAGGTQFSAQKASPESQAAYETLWDGDLWMIYRNANTSVLHWDFSALNRMISFAVADDQATGSIQVNVSRIQQLGDEWNSDKLKSVGESLSESSSSANSGNLVGNRMFYANDYMVQRGPGYVSSLKMYSSRTLNTECTNSQNPYGFHLSDGTLYTYIDGTQYEDIAGAWDWNLIPGTTTDYAATKLTCEDSKFSTSEDFVGGVSDGKLGAAAMRYKNPSTGSLSFQKAWFFLDNDVQHVMISQASSNSSSKNPVISVLDQKRLNGPVYVDGKQLDKGGNFSQASSLWHDNVGYTFETQDAPLSVDFGSRESDWSSLGISEEPKGSVDIFSAWISHGSGSDLTVPAAYTAYPAVSPDEFRQKSQATRLTTIQNDDEVSAVYDETHNTAMFVFWKAEGGSAMFAPSSQDGFLIMEASANAVVIYDMDVNSVTVSDPSQTLKSVQLTISRGVMDIQAVDVTLPSGGDAGKSVTQKL
ncbi:polysaccharide lyase family 8 protein [Cerioporus squamosus]|nr:polysaccharide lyase family 8 protein [Cerioporus squamosus]